MWLPGLPLRSLRRFLNRYSGLTTDPWRRAALVSTVPLNLRAAGGTGDSRRTLNVCRLLVDDRDDMVVKALSWALRALVIWDADAVRSFLDDNGMRLAARVQREVTNKLETGLKNPVPDPLQEA